MAEQTTQKVKKYVYMILRKYKDNVAAIEAKDDRGEAMAFETPKLAKAFLESEYKPNEPDAWLFAFYTVKVPFTILIGSNIKLRRA